MDADIAEGIPGEIPRAHLIKKERLPYEISACLGVGALCTDSRIAITCEKRQRDFFLIESLEPCVFLAPASLLTA